MPLYDLYGSSLHEDNFHLNLDESREVLLTLRPQIGWFLGHWHMTWACIHEPHFLKDACILSHLSNLSLLNHDGDGHVQRLLGVCVVAVWVGPSSGSRAVRWASHWKMLLLPASDVACLHKSLWQSVPSRRRHVVAWLCQGLRQGRALCQRPNQGRCVLWNLLRTWLQQHSSKPSQNHVEQALGKEIQGADAPEANDWRMGGYG